METSGEVDAAKMFSVEADGRRRSGMFVCSIMRETFRWRDDAADVVEREVNDPAGDRGWNSGIGGRLGRGTPFEGEDKAERMDAGELGTAATPTGEEGVGGDGSDAAVVGGW